MKGGEETLALDEVPTSNPSSLVVATMEMKDIKEVIRLQGEHSSDIECSPCNDRGIKTNNIYLYADLVFSTISSAHLIKG